MKLINPNHVIADNFEFFRKGSDSLIYIENNNNLRIQVEAGYDPNYYVAVYLSSVNEWDYPLNELIDPHKKQEIERNILQGFQLMRTRIKIE